MTTQLAAEQIRDLPPLVDVPTAAAVLGVGKTAAYQLIRNGAWPTPVVRVLLFPLS